MRVVKALRDVGVRDISGLMPESVSNLTGLVDRTRELEKLPLIDQNGSMKDGSTFRGLGDHGARIRELIAQVDLPDPWDRAQFVQNVEKARGRPITMVPSAAACLIGAPCGLWLVREHDDIIVYEDGTSDYHVDQIVLHEIGHMLLGHDKNGKESGPGPMVASLMPQLDLKTVKATLGRTAYDNEQERDAELFASLILIGQSEKKRMASPFRYVFYGNA